MLLIRGISHPSVATIQEWLNFLGFYYKGPAGNYEPLKVSGKFDDKTEAAVLDFQRSQNLLVDGIIGPITMKALQDEYTRRTIELSSPGIDSTDGHIDRFYLRRVNCDSFGEGYTRMSLRNDVADAYDEVRNWRRT